MGYRARIFTRENCSENATFKGHNLKPLGFLGRNFWNTHSFKDDIRVGPSSLTAKAKTGVNFREGHGQLILQSHILLDSEYP